MSAIGELTRGVRVVAHHRRGCDRSSQASSGNNRATLVAHSTAGEPARYIGRHGTKRVAGTVLRWRKGKESKNV